MKLYETEAGSTVEVNSRGSWSIDFDWLEEDACDDAHAWFEDETDGPHIVWTCACCNGLIGAAKLTLRVFDSLSTLAG